MRRPNVAATRVARELLREDGRQRWGTRWRWAYGTAMTREVRLRTAEAESWLPRVALWHLRSNVGCLLIPTETKINLKRKKRRKKKKIRCLLDLRHCLTSKTPTEGKTKPHERIGLSAWLPVKTMDRFITSLALLSVASACSGQISQLPHYHHHPHTHTRDCFIVKYLALNFEKQTLKNLSAESLEVHHQKESSLKISR